MTPPFIYYPLALGGSYQDFSEINMSRDSFVPSVAVRLRS